MTADVEKMYRQIWVSEEDCSLQRIFWRQAKSDELKCYELKTVTYGTASAPYLATRCLNQLAINHQISHPQAADRIKNDFYVDDLLSGADSKEELYILKQDIASILSSAGFHLRKWLSNEPSLCASNSTQTNYNVDRNSDVKTLGIDWNAETDHFTYSYKSNACHETQITKRSILSISAQLFDPLGLLNPITIIAKLIMQTLWQHKLTWDESVPQDIHTRWHHFKNDLKLLNNIKVPRYACMSNATSIELHGFCDASERAYGACIYIRAINKFDNNIKTTLVCAKSRVAPLRQITLLRLELCAAVLLANLMSKVINSAKIKFNSICYWSDSTITLSWINAPSSRWQTFVANRVATIQRLSTCEQWNHVKSNDNPADLISRGTTITELVASTQWWHGPTWLGAEWTIQKNLFTPEDAPEQRKSTKAFLVTNVLDIGLFNKYSSFYKLIRVTAWIQRFISNCKSAEKVKQHFLLTSELTVAKTKLILMAQSQCFNHELRALKKDKILNSKGLISLNPFIDSDGILRVGGRLGNSSFSYSKKHPVILSPKHPFTKLIIKSEHRKNLHCGPQTLLSIIREKYWPIAGKNLVKQIIRNCTICFRVKPQSVNPIMGELPAPRLTPAPAFHNCGVDYAGPVLLKDKRTRGNRTVKAYICLFVCMVTKCVHIELVGSLTAEAFIACLRRFIARRGKPICFHSDNATNFVGARAEIRELYEFLNASKNIEAISNNLTNDGISWKFIPARSPHFGGIWESAIKSMKAHMKRVLGNASLVFEDLNTVLVQIEAILNSRPLCALSSDPSDISPLTPGHFLIGRPLISLPDHNLLHIKEGRLSQFQRLQQLTQHIWSRWSKEYVSQLQTRTKWKKNASAVLKEGQLVIIREENLPPLKWQLGRVVKLHPGKDNVVRVAEIKTSQGALKRAVSKLCVLPSDP